MKFTPNQTITLADFNSVQNNPVIKGQPVKVKVISTGIIENDQARIELITLKNSDIVSILEVDGQKQYLYLQRDTTFRGYNRRQMLEANMESLFEEPATADYDLNELVFTSEITDDDLGITYDREFSFLGEYAQMPQMRGIQDMFGGFTQYYIRPSSKETIHHFLVILEIGTLSSNDGGVVNIYKGWEITENDIK